MIPKKFKWAAFDRAGTVVLYTSRPICKSYGWRITEISPVRILHNVDTQNKDWTKSLTERPQPSLILIES